MAPPVELPIREVNLVELPSREVPLEELLELVGWLAVTVLAGCLVCGCAGRANRRTSTVEISRAARWDRRRTISTAVAQTRGQDRIGATGLGGKGCQTRRVRVRSALDSDCPETALWTTGAVLGRLTGTG